MLASQLTNMGAAHNACLLACAREECLSFDKLEI